MKQAHILPKNAKGLLQHKSLVDNSTRHLAQTARFEGGDVADPMLSMHKFQYVYVITPFTAPRSEFAAQQ